ncbi:hypothetical protein HDV00_006518 [Rhizophlyctis rosea]|nr:hypothetical protein HDV00_006518 [Rhizophlyctis rosea]
MPHIEVQLLAAENLRNRDLFGSNDAFVELWLDKHYKHRSTVVKNDKNPTWNETFTFYIWGKKPKLHVRVVDDDILFNDTVGEVVIDVSRAVGGEVMDEEHGGSDWHF